MTPPARSRASKLSLYLFKEDVTSLESVIRPSYLEGIGALEEVEPLARLPFEARAFVQRNRESVPKWLPFLSDHFDTADIRNVTNSFVLVFRAENRVFALTFGFGFNALDRSKLEPAFGLKVCANSLDADALKTLDLRTIDVVTRQQRTHVSLGSKLSEFGIEPDRDWVRFLAGKPSSAEFARSLAGADSLAISTDCRLDELASKCAQILERFQADDYKENFGFIDYLRPLRKDDPVVEELEAVLAERIAQRSTERISASPPEVPDEEALAGYVMKGPRVEVTLDEPRLEDIYAVLEEYQVERPLEKFKLWPVNDAGEPIRRQHALRDFIVLEVPRGEKLYVLSIGQWFEIDSSHAAAVASQVEAIEDATEELALPPMESEEDEGDYNERVAEDRQWLCLDTKFIYHGGLHQKVELCDLVTPDRDLVCIKKMSSSATLSHLFSQGSVAARLYRRDLTFRSKARDLIKKTGWEDFDLGEPGEQRFIFGIATDKHGSLPETLFFFSRLALIMGKQEIEERGFRVALAKIEQKTSAPQGGSGG